MYKWPNIRGRASTRTIAPPRALAQIRLESARRESGATQAGRGRYVRFARGYVLKQRVAPSKAATSEARAARADFNKRACGSPFIYFP